MNLAEEGVKAKCSEIDDQAPVEYLGYRSPPELRRWGAEPPPGGSCVSALKVPVRTNVYIDGFNLYYGALKGTPYRWLDVAKFCTVILPRDTIHRIRYYTAAVRPRPHDPDQRARQELYLRALRTIPNLTIHEGHFLAHVVAMPSASNPARMVDVIKTEEKGSDVNLAAHLLRDAFVGDFEVAVVVSNDSDLLEPIRIVQQELGKPVGILNPQKHPSWVLKQEARFFKNIRHSALVKCQFPDELRDGGGAFRKPGTW